MTDHPLAGVYAAAVTPLKSDYALELEGLPRLHAFLAGRGCHGVVLLGTTGEGPSFSPEERLQLFRAACAARQSHPEFRLLAGTGTPSLTETIDLTKAAFDLGLDGVLVLPPYYFRKATDDGLFLFFETLIHKAVPSDGFLLGYHFPSVAGIGFSPDLLSRLKETFPRQFAGIKDSSHDAGLARTLGERFGADLLVLNGTDSDLQLAMQSQAGGCVTAAANLISPNLRALWEAYRAGAPTEALQARVTAKREVLEHYAPFPAILKALLHRLHGFPRWAVRPPLMPTADDAAAQAADEFTRID